MRLACVSVCLNAIACVCESVGWQGKSVAECFSVICSPLVALQLALRLLSFAVSFCDISWLLTPTEIDIERLQGLRDYVVIL